MAKRYYDEELRREQSKFFANMPDKVVMKEYPDPMYGLDASMNDNIYGVDEHQKKYKKTVEKNLERGY